MAGAGQEKAMLLGFKRQFEQPIITGLKRHTIRNAGRDWKPGRVCDCYIDARQKTMRLIGRWPCVKVEPIAMCLQRLPLRLLTMAIRIDGVVLDDSEAEAFAQSDGFPDLFTMARFWRTYNALLPGSIWRGIVIHWDYDRPLPAMKKATGRAVIRNGG